jgi:hypothetical protein
MNNNPAPKIVNFFIFAILSKNHSNRRTAAIPVSSGVTRFFITSRAPVRHSLRDGGTATFFKTKCYTAIWVKITEKFLYLNRAAKNLKFCLDIESPDTVVTKSRQLMLATFIFKFKNGDISLIYGILALKSPAYEVRIPPATLIFPINLKEDRNEKESYTSAGIYCFVTDRFLCVRGLSMGRAK